jgi:hypothetical protein
MNRILMDICTDQKKAEKLIASPLFIGFRAISENCLAVFRRQPCVKWNKMYAIGMSILEASKLAMYKAYYDVFQPYFHAKALADNKTDMGVSVGMTDTDRYAHTA